MMEWRTLDFKKRVVYVCHGVEKRGLPLCRCYPACDC